MTRRHLLVETVLGAVAVLGGSVIARADTVYSGIVFCNESAVAASTPTLSTLASAEAGGTECATFSATAISFNSSVSAPYTLGGFLTSDGAAFNITFLNGFGASSDLDNTLWIFTGTASFTNGQTFNVQHDDGTNMYVNGALVLGAPGPTAPVISTFTYTGANGNFPFEFIFTECCGPPAAYSTSLAPTVSTVPEPGTLSLIGLGIVGVVSKFRRKKQAPEPDLI